jgi:hypothetical protein
MLTIRKTLLVAAALALAPTFALAQTGAETAKAPAAISSTQTATAATKTADAGTTAAKATVAKSHKGQVRHAAKVKKTKTAKLVKKTKTAKLSRTAKVAQIDKTSNTANTVMKPTPVSHQK